MPPESSQLSYQTTMPEYPDISYETYLSQYYPNSQTTAGKNVLWINPYAPKYDTWANSRISQYDAKVSAYNTWLQTGAGKRASALSGEYNPSYFDTGSPSMSPLGYNQTGQESPFSDMAKGVSGIFEFASALQGMLATHQQILGAKLQNAGQSLTNDKLSLQNEAQRINNLFLERLLNNRLLYTGRQADYMAHQANYSKSVFEQHLARRFGGIPKLDKKTGLLEGGALGYGTPNSFMSYDLTDANNGFTYQRGVADLGLISASTSLKNAQVKLAEADEKVKSFYHDEIQLLEKQFLKSRIGLVDSQKEAQDIINGFLPDIKDIEFRGKKFGLTHEQISTVIEVLQEVGQVFRFFAGSGFGGLQ